jgi:hypothetical protein
LGGRRGGLRLTRVEGPEQANEREKDEARRVGFHGMGKTSNAQRPTSNAQWKNLIPTLQSSKSR